MVNDNAVVTKIVIKVSGKEVEFSLEEAKELTKILQEMFGEKNTVYIPYEVSPRVWYPYNPYWTVTCDTSTYKSTAVDNTVTVTYQSKVS